MKNLLFVNYYDLHGGGGTSSVTFSLASELKKEGNNVFIASTGEYPGIETFVFKKIRLFPLFIIRDMYLKHIINKIVKKNKIEIIHICESRFSSIAAIEIGKKYNIPCVVHYHDYWFNCLRGDLLYRGKEFCSGMSFFKCLGCQKKSRMLWEAYKYLYFIKRFNKLKTAEAHIAISTTIENELKKGGIKKIVNIPNMINSVNEIDEKQIEKKYSEVIDFVEGKKIVSFVGRLVENKGIKNYLEIAKITIRQNINVVFLIIGDGVMRDYCRKFIDKNSLSKNIKMLGYVENKKIDFFYKLSDVILVPTLYYEVFPMTTVEAMNNAKVIITSDRGGNKDLISSGKNGILINPNNFHDVSDVLLNTIMNRELMSAIGVAAQERVKCFSKDKIIAKVINLYDKLIKGEKI